MKKRKQKGLGAKAKWPNLSKQQNTSSLKWKKNKKMAKKVKMIEEKGDNGVQKGGK
jgi:hypothetical protein